MAEPIAIITKISIEEKSLQSFLRKKNTIDESLKNIDFFASLLYRCENNSGNIFLFHYESNTLFLAYWLNYFTEEQIAPLRQTLHHLCRYKLPETDLAFLSDSSGALLQVYQLTASGLEEVPKSKVDNRKYSEQLKECWAIFRLFSIRNDFPEPAKALRKRNYFYKPLKLAYKRYLKRKEEEEKPKKIRTATKENPFYYLFNNNYFSYDLKVFYRDQFTGSILELPNADPFTFGLKGLSMDKNHFFQYYLYVKKPVGVGKFSGNNKPKIKAIFFTHPTIDPQTFNYVKERWDTVFWKDKNHIYIFKKERLKNTHVFRHYFKPVTEADVNSFEYLDFQYGKDKNHLFHLDTILPLNPKKFQLNRNGFLYDDKYIFHYGTAIEMDAKTFKIISFESNVNPFMGPYILQDKNGKYKYDVKTKIVVKLN